MRNPVDAEILAGFFEEARGYLPEIRDGLGSLGADPSHPQPLAELRRLFHSLKGAAGMVGLADLGQMAKLTEDLVEDIGAGLIAINEASLEALVVGAETIEGTVSRCEDGDFSASESVAQLTQMYAQLERVAANGNGNLSGHGPSAHPKGSGAGLDLLPPDEWLDDSPDDDMIAAFGQECQEQLAVVREQILDMAAGAPDAAGFRAVREVLQMLRSASGMVSFDEFGAVAQQAESLLQSLEADLSLWKPETAELLAGAVEGLCQLAQQDVDPEELGQLAEQFAAQAQPSEASAASVPASAAPARMEVLPSDDHSAPEELVEAFQMEAEEHLQTITQSLEVLEGSPTDKERLQDVRRSMHTLKGAAGMVGLRRASRMAHRAEDLLDQLYDTDRPLTKEIHGLLLATADAISDLTSGEGGAVPDERLQQILSGFAGVLLVDSPGHLEQQDALPPQSSAAAAPQPAGPEPLPSDDLGAPEELVEAFEMEAEELLQSITASLQVLESSPEDKTRLQDVRRSMHTLKGAAGMVGLRRASRMAHRAEDLLDQLYDTDRPLTKEIHGLLLATADAISDLTSGEGGPVPDERLQQILSGYVGALATASPDAAVAAGQETPAQPARTETAPPEPLDAPEPLVAPEALEEPELPEAPEPLAAPEPDLAAALDAPPPPELSEPAAQQVAEPEPPSAPIPAPIPAPAPAPAPPVAAPRPAPPASPPPAVQVTPPKPPARPAPPPQPRMAPRLTPAPAPAVAASAASESRNVPTVRIPLDKLDDLVKLVSELVVNRSTFEQHFGRYTHEVDELGLSTERLRRAAVKLETDYAVSALIAQEAGAAAGAGPVVRGQTTTSSSQSQFDSLEFDRYTDFHLLSRDITETTADVASTAHQFSSLISDFDGYLTRLGRLTSEVQDRLMRLRMVPMSSVTPRLQRTVRVTAQRQGKQVGILVEGDSTELDKTVLEEITGPLEHLLRNSVDHGIEPAEARTAAGKPAEGTIRIRAYYEGTQVVILVSDDGGGLNPDRLRVKAVENGFLSQRDAERTPDEDLYALVFETGFSTAQQISEVSGRGVGLDIVKSTVNKLKGTVTIESERGVGVTFRIRLPMSLAVARVLLVQAGGERLAIPLASVSQIRRADPEQLERVGQTPVVRFPDRLMPALHLGEALGLTGSALPEGRIPVLCIQSGDKQVGLIVEHIIEAREVVVKTLGNVLRRVPGVSGATLMGDGSVVLIVNPAEIVEDTGKARRQVRPRRQRSRPQRSAVMYDILIVDDSLSVRRVLTNLVKSAGWSSTQAKDGVEALELLNRRPKPPDAILLDIEMPRMDGYELTQTLRGQEAFRDVPIIMLTSRSGEKHRKRAFELGATDYLVKPYQDEAMLSAVRRVIADARHAPQQ